MTKVQMRKPEIEHGVPQQENDTEIETLAANDVNNVAVGTKRRRTMEQPVVVNSTQARDTVDDALPPPAPARPASPQQQQQQPDRNDKWKEVVNGDDMRLHKFRFIPAKNPGVLSDLDSNSSAYECFLELYSLEVQETLVTLINEYAVHKLQENLPACRYSRFSNWTPISRYELLKLIAVLLLWE